MALSKVFPINIINRYFFLRRLQKFVLAARPRPVIPAERQREPESITTDDEEKIQTRRDYGFRVRAFFARPGMTTWRIVSRRVSASEASSPRHEDSLLLLVDSLPAPKREAERREAHCSANVRAKRGARLPLREMRRLSALTLAALATGYHPDGSAPEPGFHDAVTARCFAGKPRRCVALSTLRADRSLCRSTGDPEPPGSGWQIRRAGTAPRSASTACLSGKAPYG